MALHFLPALPFNLALDSLTTGQPGLPGLRIRPNNRALRLSCSDANGQSASTSTDQGCCAVFRAVSAESGKADHILTSQVVHIIAQAPRHASWIAASGQNAGLTSSGGKRGLSARDRWPVAGLTIAGHTGEAAVEAAFPHAPNGGSEERLLRTSFENAFAAAVARCGRPLKLDRSAANCSTGRPR